MRELLLAPVATVASKLQAREVSSVELVEASFDHIDATDHRLNAFPVLMREEAIRAARSADRQRKRDSVHQPLLGIPVGLKDNVAVKGWPTTCGSPLLASHVTDYDAAVVERLRAAGAIVLGKNNMHEWALAGSCTYSVFGPTHNPWNTDYITGGSSGGSAAAVASGQAFISIGTDARASIRNPASYCGVVGHKPTHGLVSRYGELPPTSSWYMTIGPIARHVEDIALTMNAIAGYDARDPSSASAGPRDFTAHLKEGVAGLRVALITNFFYEDTVHEIETAVHDAAQALKNLGAVVSERRVDMLDHWGLMETAFEGENKGWLLQQAIEHPEAFLHDDIRYRILAGAFTNTVDTLRSTRILNLLRHEVAALMRDVDLLLVPTNSTAAYRADATSVPVRGNDIDPASPGGQSRLTTRLTVPFNALALPAISIPGGVAAHGLPFGVQLVGRAFEDDLVLRAAWALEQQGLGFQSPPTIT